MAKRYDVNDFTNVSYSSEGEEPSNRHSNDEVQKIPREQRSLQQRASYLAGYLAPAIANDEPVEQQERGEALLKQFKKLQSLRSRRSKEWYERESRRLQQGMLTLCRDPSCSASPTAKQLREKIEKAFGGDREH